MKKPNPPHVTDFLIARADAKRKRRAAKPGASAYAKANWPRK